MIELANKVQIRLRSQRSKKYLRCNKQGGVDATAGKSPDSVFMVHRINANEFKLQSCENPTQWVACSADGVISENGKGGASCVFIIKHHERDIITLSPKHELDWHIGVDEFGRVLNAKDVPHSPQAAFIIELVNAQILL
ncbi:Fibroblast_growth factor family protein [Hexamita inflata]|uniref:Fibroblast growth factor family protein n=1 Tax=Hexamita inflata TaxID=28002 RepID=A0AA86QFE9_9EUKA|nr:Fibroblast growth factor family protein [Hexamita inflata]CAI9940744.1 Fibroblast growth factor family protein [Hexamita inflata]CAI9952069.1 Fibroblast growth factor family protein [Hexamita inflata]